MSTMLLDRADLGRWKAHAHVDVYGADKMAGAARMAADLGRFMSPDGEVHAPAPRDWLGRRQPRLAPIPANLARLGIHPDEQIDKPGNLLTTAGLTRLFNLLIASGGLQAYDATHTGILVGDTSTAATVADTDLGAAVAAANRYGQLVSGANVLTAGPPTLITVAATFATGNANFVWNEWGIDQRTASGATAATAAFLNHKITNIMTKTSAIAAAFSVTITIT